ncbi:MAG: methyltransferase [Ilumatobacteraceae bacterium]|jgi:16S rRNA (guanine1207-N2)-methyltransferase|nr:methyltransferase [Acidimicrobiaceae bacterium]MBK9970971.1 methyltransferase [Acidimicrobiaceae bacterium]MBP8211519.1 methyltransferase [Ilumatobacteraceae bacterium]
MTAPGSHYFDEEPTTDSSPRVVQLLLPDLQLALTTDRGVFGYDRIDAGTKLLLLRAPAPAPTGNLLDIGSGTGAIALTMARRCPAATVWAVDVNERARDLCRSNAERNGLTNVNVCSPDDVPADVTFDTIWSNPAIRIGKPALHAMLLRWLSRLSPAGEVVLVVHKHLGSDSLQAWLSGQGYPTTRLASSSGYRILHATH